jgi:dTDP-glucose 4,6-dehydratase
MILMVTGVAGFIGANFVHYYLQNHPDTTLIGLDALTYAGNLENLNDLTEEQKSRFIFIRGDITDSDTVKSIFTRWPVQGVINFAAESHVDRSIHDPSIFLKTNILGTHTLLDAAKTGWYADGKWKEGTRFLQVSTDEVYGSLGPDGLFSEKTPLDPHSPYSASKAGSDLIVKAYHDTFGMPAIITRCSNNYGPYQFPEKLIPLIITRALAHQSLPVYGDGRQIRDWLYVRDHCRAIDMAFHQGKTGEVYNIGGSNEQENIVIIRLILQILREIISDQEIDEKLITHVTDRLGHDRRYAIDASKITKELGWEPETSFEEGIRRTIQWYLNHPSWTERVLSGEYQEFYEKNYGSGR